MQQAKVGRVQFRWMQQNRYELDELYDMINSYRQNNGSTLLSKMTYDSFLSFVLANSQTYVNPYLPVYHCENGSSEDDDDLVDLSQQAKDDRSLKAKGNG